MTFGGSVCQPLSNWLELLAIWRAAVPQDCRVPGTAKTYKMPRFPAIRNVSVTHPEQLEFDRNSWSAPQAPLAESAYQTQRGCTGVHHESPGHRPDH